MLDANDRLRQVEENRRYSDLHAGDNRPGTGGGNAGPGALFLVTVLSLGGIALLRFLLTLPPWVLALLIAVFCILVLLSLLSALRDLIVSFRATPLKTSLKTVVFLTVVIWLGMKLYPSHSGAQSVSHPVRHASGGR